MVFFRSVKLSQRYVDNDNNSHVGSGWLSKIFWDFLNSVWIVGLFAGVLQWQVVLGIEAI